MPNRIPIEGLSTRLTRRAERAIQRTTDLAYVAGLGLAVSASPVIAQPASDAPKTDEAAMTQTQPAKGELGRELETRKQQFEQAAPAELIETFEKGVRDVEALGVLERAKNVGDQAPMFELPDGTGETVTLAGILKSGPAIVTFYRGSWCPYCNIQLRSYQQHLDQFRALGAELVAISPEKPTPADAEDAPNYEFHVLSDSGNEVADAFGIRYRLPDELIDAFSGRLDLAEYNGDGSWTLPLGATYVIDAEGRIVYSYLSADYRTRAEPEDLIAALRSIGSDG